MSNTPATISREAPTHAVLIQRIEQYCEFPIVDTNAENVARLITNKCLEGAICAGAIVGPPPGKWRALRFADYYAEVFGVDLAGKRVKPPRKRKVA